MMNIEAFRKNYPLQTMVVHSGKAIQYRYFKHPQAKATVVLLIGGLGFSDLLYLHFERFAKDFSVLIVDYEQEFVNNGEFGDMLADLLHNLNEKAWLVGLYLGGVVAQVVASRHSDVVTGMVLVNTCLLSKEMGSQMMDLLDGWKIQKSKMSLLPFSVVKRSIKRTLLDSGKKYTRSEKAALEDLCEILMRVMTKQRLLFLFDSLKDVKKYCKLTKSDFANWEHRVLLTLSEDVSMFIRESQQAFDTQLLQSVIYTDLSGNYLAPFVHLNQFTEVITDFILERSH